MVMRVSTPVYFQTSLAGIRDQQAMVADLSRKIASGERFASPKESPVDAVKIAELTSSLARRAQYVENQDKAQYTLKFQEVVLGEMSRSLASARALIANTSPTHSLAVREQYAAQVANLYLHIKDLANARDSKGNYLFGGHVTTLPPFTHTPAYPPAGFPTDSPDAAYAGDNGVREVVVEDGRQLQVSEVLQGAFDAGGPNDLLEALDQVAIDLRDPNLTQAQLDNALAVIRGAIDAIEVIRTRIAGRMTELEDIRQSTRQIVNDEKDTLDRIRELDKAEAIIELQMRQTNLQAAQQAFSITSKLTLFNYL